jgi:hypothetical protein
LREKVDMRLGRRYDGPEAEGFLYLRFRLEDSGASISTRLV